MSSSTESLKGINSFKSESELIFQTSEMRPKAVAQSKGKGKAVFSAGPISQDEISSTTDYLSNSDSSKQESTKMIRNEDGDQLTEESQQGLSRPKSKRVKHESDMLVHYFDRALKIHKARSKQMAKKNSNKSHPRYGGLRLPGSAPPSSTESQTTIGLKPNKPDEKVAKRQCVLKKPSKKVEGSKKSGKQGRLAGVSKKLNKFEEASYTLVVLDVSCFEENETQDPSVPGFLVPKFDSYAKAPLLPDVIIID